MKSKTLLISVLAIILCFSFTFATLAATTSPKDLVLTGIENMDLDFSQKFYNQSSGNITYTVNRFGGNSLKEVNIPGGTTLDCDFKLDVPGKKSAIDLVLKYNNKTYPGQMFLSEDKLIFTKSFVAAIKELAPQSDIGNLSQYPEYLYFSNPIMTQVWTTMLDYPNAKITEETKDLIKFFVEAIPAEYFSTAGNTVTLELDQNGLEDAVYAILQKVKNEKTRFAEIVVTLATTYDTTGTMGNPQHMKAEIIKGIDEAVNSGSWPTKEQIQMISSFIQVKQFKYQSSIIPGGQKNFDAIIALQPQTGFTGQIDITSESKGKTDNLTGIYKFKLSFTEPGGTSVNGAFEGDVTIKDDKITQGLVLSATAKKATGVVEFDVAISGQSTQQVEDGMVVNIPVLTSSNSLNIDEYMNKSYAIIGGSSGPTTIEVVSRGNTPIFVNSRIVVTDAEPFMQNGRMMVPVRFISESLNAEVRWIDPNVIRIIRGNQVISMFAGETSYILDGQQAQMDTVPVVKDGRTFVPVRFVAEALNCDVNYTDNKVYINSR
ncbi:MAG: copper amine oxidase N-terminal domain-containing protein [Desulfotomaculaceae bacterium]